MCAELQPVVLFEVDHSHAHPWEEVQVEGITLYRSGFSFPCNVCQRPNAQWRVKSGQRDPLFARTFAQPYVCSVPCLTKWVIVARLAGQQLR